MTSQRIFAKRTALAELTNVRLAICNTQGLTDNGTKH